MVSTQHSNAVPIAGYDNNGTVYDAGELILRQISAGYLDEAKTIFNLYNNLGLKQYGIVETSFVESEGVFHHKKHIISYPFEWTANMFKEAVLFHLNLFLGLEKHGLTLKDALPSNIVFDSYGPVFVDFLSIVQRDKLKNESWLVEGTNYSDPRFAVFEKMFTPFILIPLMAMAKNDYSLARTLLAERACNCGGVEPQWGDLYSSSSLSTIKTLAKNVAKRVLGRTVKPDTALRRVKSVRQLIGTKGKLTFTDFNRRMLEFVAHTEVTPPKSAYISYYEDKSEAFDITDRSGWENKQKNVYAIISESKPKRVLDLGANTGWFSILAEKLGAEVISTDIDESCIDSLYLYAKDKRLNILPLLVPFDDLTRSIYGISYDGPDYKDRDFKTNLLFIPATERLKSDLVLCLGLIHHLVLGEGKDIELVFDVLSSLSRQTLVLEYVDLNDELVKSEPFFFRNLSNFTEENYNIHIVTDIGRRYFPDVQVMDSHPNTRKLLVFRR